MLYVPMEPPEGNVEALVGRVKTLRPDAVFSALVGLSNRRFLAAYADAGIDPADVPIASHNIPRPTWWPYDERNVPVISPRRLTSATSHGTKALFSSAPVSSWCRQ